MGSSFFIGQGLQQRLKLLVCRDSGYLETIPVVKTQILVKSMVKGVHLVALLSNMLTGPVQDVSSHSGEEWDLVDTHHVDAQLHFGAAVQLRW